MKAVSTSPTVSKPGSGTASIPEIHDSGIIAEQRCAGGVVLIVWQAASAPESSSTGRRRNSLVRSFGICDLLCSFCHHLFQCRFPPRSRRYSVDSLPGAGCVGFGGCGVGADLCGLSGVMLAF